MATGNPPAPVKPVSDALWDTIERRYFAGMRAVQEEQDREVESGFSRRRDEIKQQLRDVNRSRLELMAQLQELNRQSEAIHGVLAELDDRVASVRERKREDNEREYKERKAWCARFRRGGEAYRALGAQAEAAVDEAVGEGDHGQVEGEDMPANDVEVEDGVNRAPWPLAWTRRPSGQEIAVARPRKPHVAVIPYNTSTTPGAIVVLNGAGELIGQLPPPAVMNDFVKRMCTRAVQRAVQLRLNRHFTEDELASISRPCQDPNNKTRPTRYLGFHVQAVGEMQKPPCENCAQHRGPYRGCFAIADDQDFPRCGNCEARRKVCRRAAGVAQKRARRFKPREVLLPQRDSSSPPPVTDVAR
jgi:hypothetical protein